VFLQHAERALFEVDQARDRMADVRWLRPWRAGQPLSPPAAAFLQLLVGRAAVEGN
jgi:hypothetical protein